MNIGIDFDNVLADTTRAVLKRIWETSGGIFYLEDIKEYDFANIVQLDPKDLWQCFLDVWKRYETLQPIDDHANHYMYMLQYEGHKVKIVSAVGNEFIEDWLRYFDFLDYEVIYTGHGDKARAKTEYGFDILVDDKPSHVLDFAEQSDNAFLFIRPWNRYVLQHNITKVWNFRQIYEHVRSLNY